MSTEWEKFISKNSVDKDFSQLIHCKNDYERASLLQDLLISEATGAKGSYYENDYKLLRSYFLEEINLKNLLPKWIKLQRDLSQFWQFIKNKFSTYAERREFLWSEFSQLLEFLESAEKCPAQEGIDEILSKFDAEDIHRYWKKALERKSRDPDGAITIARTLLEGVCKHILDLQGIEYNKIPDLGELYKKTAQSLNLHAGQHEEEIFKQILGGCSAIVNGLGNLRNNLGDAHGKSKKIVKKPASRHSELAVNLAGSMALFLIQTFEHRMLHSVNLIENTQ